MIVLGNCHILFHLSRRSGPCTHTFGAPTAFPVCSSVLSFWTNRTSSKLSSSTFVHSCIGSCLFARDARCSQGPANTYVDISTISLSSYMWSKPFLLPGKANTDILDFNPLNAELNPICYFLALLGAHHFFHVSRIRVKSLTLRLLVSYIYIYIYIYGAPILDVSRSHTTTHHSR